MKKISQSIDEANLSQRDSYGRNDRKNITGLIIAAGLSSRMGKFKPLLKLNNNSFVRTIIEKMTLFCDEVIVITGHNKELMDLELSEVKQNDKIKIVYNYKYNEGMFTSLLKGIEHSTSGNWVLYHFVDQPGIPESFYEQIISEIDNDFDWIQPTYKGKKGHPILFNEKVARAILASNTNSNLKQISSKNDFRKKFVEVLTPSIFFDIDTVDDYKELTKQLEQ